MWLEVSDVKVVKGVGMKWMEVDGFVVGRDGCWR